MIVNRKEKKKHVVRSIFSHFNNKTTIKSILFNLIFIHENYHVCLQTKRTTLTLTFS